MIFLRISKFQYYLLSEKEQEGYEYHSDESGCYFEKSETLQDSKSENEIDDFERLMNKKKEG